MPEEARPLRWRQAALRLEARLRELTGQAPERLDRWAIQRCYPKRRWVAAWRIQVVFSDGVTRRIDVVATAGFPTVPVRTALVDHPEFMTWPHVESDGTLCLLPNLAECDPDDPADVAANLLHRSVRLIEELLEGSIVDRDFREEFLTYWAYKAHADGSRLFSLLSPAPPSRAVCLWRGEGIEVVGEDAESLSEWVRRRFGRGATVKIEDAAFLWLGVPWLPAAYPETASDVRARAAEIGDDAIRVLEQVAVGEPDHLVAILGAEGRGGVGLIGVGVSNPKQLRTRPRSTADPLSKGFRPGRTPKPLLVDRFFGDHPVIRSGVQRADPPWVHGRNQDPRTTRLLSATVVLIGCGSVGAPVAGVLAQAGVGRIVLVDYDPLSWPNVGRHPLGATAVGRDKAEALAERLQADYPHLHIESRSYGLHELLVADSDLLEGAELIISATGSWAAENALNRWHIEQGRGHPILYAWTEAHACAGHGVAIAGEGGCLQCHIGRTGTPDFKVVEWPDGGDAAHEEPACGAHYQPYGPVELNYVTAMIGELALDCLLDPPSESFSRVLVTSPDRLARLGGRLSEAWIYAHGAGDAGLRTVDRPWPRAICRACGPARAEEAA